MCFLYQDNSSAFNRGERDPYPAFDKSINREWPEKEAYESHIVHSEEMTSIQKIIEKIKLYAQKAAKERNAAYFATEDNTIPIICIIEDELPPTEYNEYRSQPVFFKIHY